MYLRCIACRGTVELFFHSDVEVCLRRDECGRAISRDPDHSRSSPTRLSPSMPSETLKSTCARRLLEGIETSDVVGTYTRLVVAVADTDCRCRIHPVQETTRTPKGYGRWRAIGFMAHVVISPNPVSRKRYRRKELTETVSWAKGFPAITGPTVWLQSQMSTEQREPSD